MTLHDPCEHDSFPWYAVQVRTGRERLATSLLEGKGYRPFLPVYNVRIQLCDRAKDASRPLFPGYIFCRFDPNNRLPVLMTHWVLQIVGSGKCPLPVDPEEVSAIQAVVHSELPARPWPYAQQGQVVRIEDGPLAGTEGIVVANKNRFRLIVSVELLQRSVAVEIDRCWAKPLVVLPGTVCA